MFASGRIPERDRTAEDRVVVIDAEELQWHRFQKAFAKATGLDLNEYRGAQMRKRVRSIVQSAGESLDSLTQRLEDGPVLATVMLHQIAIHTTQLFRDFDRWIDLQENIVPELTARNKQMAAWCAACANGADAYSLASILESMEIKTSITATDIDSVVLEQAVKGKFSNAQGKNARAFLSPSHFETRSDSYLAKPCLARRIAFKQHNLLNDPPRENFDLVCCRNIAIYLKDSACDKLYRNLSRALRPGGFLFVGTTERLFAPEEYGFESISPCFYRKLD